MNYSNLISGQIQKNIESNKTENPYRYSNFSCIDPVAVYTDEPWYPMKNTCPCNPNLSNPTGRGFTPCPFGLNYQDKQTRTNQSKKPLMTVVSDISGPNYRAVSVPVTDTKGDKIYHQGEVIPGSMFPTNQYAAPQAEPRALMQIGHEWRSAPI